MLLFTKKIYSILPISVLFNTDFTKKKKIHVIPSKQIWNISFFKQIRIENFQINHLVLINIHIAFYILLAILHCFNNFYSKNEYMWYHQKRRKYFNLMWKEFKFFLYRQSDNLVGGSDTAGLVSGAVFYINPKRLGSPADHNGKGMWHI